ncbi:MAG: hypothetical protein Q7T81_01410 [Pseudolabrys sp.]|nr:hypothetical protein [Pseudolabrys sp.]
MRYAPFSLETARKTGVAALLLVTSGLLTGCQTGGSPSNPISELAAYNAKKDEAKTAAKPAEPPMTRSRAAMECWTKVEKSNAGSNIDKRADIVNKCIDDKLKVAEAPKS